MDTNLNIQNERFRNLNQHGATLFFLCVTLSNMNFTVLKTFATVKSTYTYEPRKHVALKNMSGKEPRPGRQSYPERCVPIYNIVCKLLLQYRMSQDSNKIL